MISGKLNNLSMKYESITPSGCKDIGIRKIEFLTIVFKLEDFTTESNSDQNKS